MTTFRVRGLKESTVLELKARAAKHGRSVSEEAIEIIEAKLDRMMKDDSEFRRAVREDAARPRGSRSR